MSFRFRKRLKLFPGLWINLFKRGGSVSIGGRGATVNISKRGIRETVGLPGTGISYTTKIYRPRRSRHTLARGSPHSSAQFLAFMAVVVILLWLLSHVHGG